jgi:hypothetical protein
MGYGKCNRDHIVFYNHSKQDITLPLFAMYVDDIINTDDNEVEIAKLKGSSSKAFDVKDLGRLNFFSV